MSPEEEAFQAKVRGQRARHILEDEIYIDAIEKAKRNLHVELARMDVTEDRAPEKALIHVIRLQALEEIVFQLQSIMTTGESA